MAVFGAVPPATLKFHTKTPLEQAKQAVVGYVLHAGGKISSDAGSAIVGEFGSQLKTRLLGGAFIGRESLPREVVVSFETLDGQTVVTVTARDAVGFGSRLGMADKLQLALYESAQAIKSLFPDAL